MVEKGLFCYRRKGPRKLKCRSYPRRCAGMVDRPMPASQPMGRTNNGQIEEGKCQPEQSSPLEQRRTADGSGKRSESLSLGNAFSHEPCSAKRCQAWQKRLQSVMRVGQREQRKEGKCFPANGAATFPVVMLVGCLLAPASVTDDRLRSQTGHRRR